MQVVASHKQDHTAGYLLSHRDIVQVVFQPLGYIITQGVFTALLSNNCAGRVISCVCVVSQHIVQAATSDQPAHKTNLENEKKVRPNFGF